MPSTSSKANAPELKGLPNLEQEIRQWQRVHFLWQAIYYAIGISAPVLSLALALKPEILDFRNETWEALNWFSAVLVFLLAFLNPLSKAKSWQQAINRLLPAYREYYDFTGKTIAPKDLMIAYREAREIASRAE